MLRSRSLLTLLVAGSLAGCGLRQPTADPATSNVTPVANVTAAAADPGTALLAAYEAAHRAGDVEAALALVHQAGIEPAVLDNFRLSFSQDFAAKLVRVELLPPAEGQYAPYEHGGARYRINLEPVAKLRVTVDSGDPSVTEMSTEYAVGEFQGAYRIATAVRDAGL